MSDKETLFPSNCQKNVKSEQVLKHTKDGYESKYKGAILTLQLEREYWMVSTRGEALEAVVKGEGVGERSIG